MAKKVRNIRRPRINPDVRAAISLEYQNDPLLTGPAMWERLKALPDRGWKVPSLRSVQKIYSDVKATGRKPELQELDRRWHLGLLPEYPQVSAEAVSHILDVQKWLRAEGRTAAITVRQALWISRLYASARDSAQLWHASEIYATLDRYSSFLKEQDTLDTSYIDQDLSEGSLKTGVFSVKLPLTPSLRGMLLQSLKDEFPDEFTKEDGQ